MSIEIIQKYPFNVAEPTRNWYYDNNRGKNAQTQKYGIKLQQ